MLKNPTIKKCYLFQGKLYNINFYTKKIQKTTNGMCYLQTNKIMEEINAREGEIDAINYYTKRYTLDEYDV